jgi:hypothetical protein
MSELSISGRDVNCLLDGGFATVQALLPAYSGTNGTSENGAESGQKKERDSKRVQKNRDKGLFKTIINQPVHKQYYAYLRDDDSAQSGRAHGYKELSPERIKRQQVKKVSG